MAKQRTIHHISVPTTLSAVKNDPRFQLPAGDNNWAAELSHAKPLRKKGIDTENYFSISCNDAGMKPGDLCFAQWRPDKYIWLMYCDDNGLDGAVYVSKLQYP